MRLFSEDNQFVSNRRDPGEIFRNMIVLGMIVIFLIAQFCAEMKQGAESRNLENPVILTVALEEGDKTDPIEVVAMAKRFCLAMRRSYLQANLAEMRSYFASAFLQKNNLEEGVFRSNKLSIRNIRNIQVADDLQTALC